MRRCAACEPLACDGGPVHYCGRLQSLCAPRASFSPEPFGKQAALAEKAATEAQEKIDAQALPIRTYLDQTVVPILLQGLSDLVKQRCAPVHLVFFAAQSCPVSLCAHMRGRLQAG